MPYLNTPVKTHPPVEDYSIEHYSTVLYSYFSEEGRQNHFRVMTHDKVELESIIQLWKTKPYTLFAVNRCVEGYHDEG